MANIQLVAVYVHLFDLMDPVEKAEAPAVEQTANAAEGGAAQAEVAPLAAAAPEAPAPEAPEAPAEAAPEPQAEAAPEPQAEAPASAPPAAAPQGEAPKKTKRAKTQTAPQAAEPAPSTREALEAAVEAEPRDGERWLALLAHVRKQNDVDEMRSVYERFFGYFPNASAQWIEYVEMELAHSNFEQVDAIFTRCLRSTLSVDLWKLYLAYTRRVNPLPPYTAEENSPREQTRRVLEGAYDFALKYIGWDRDSGGVWQDYIHLIRERETQGAWQDGQKMDQLRRVYQRAVVVPLNHVEAIWREYDAYENSLSKLTAKKLLSERSPAYMQARTVLRELENLTENLARPTLPVLPCWVAPSAEAAAAGRQPARERQQFGAWRRYLEWEAGNPLMLDDQAAFQARVLSAYKKAVMYVRFDPVVWYMAARFCTTTKRDAEAALWLRNGMDACPWSFLLHFAYAEHCQAHGQYAEGTAALDTLTAYVQAQVQARLDALAAAQQRVDAEIDAERAREARRLQQLDSALDEDAENENDAAPGLVEIERRLHEERAQRKAQLEADARPALDEWRDAVAQLWIKYMNFVRRAEGIRASRQIFARARRSPFCTWPVYEANALLEYHCSKEPGVATKVFELALRTFGTDEHLVVRYLDYLIAINDDTNARAVFERTISSVPVERARVIWDRWAKYEYCFGDASAVARLESRLSDLYPDESAVERAADRDRYGSLDMIRAKDLGLSKASAQALKKGSALHATATAPAPAAEKQEEEEQEAPAEDAPAAPSAAGGGRKSMEEIRKSLAASADVPRPKESSEKRAWGPGSGAKAEPAPPSKKARQDTGRKGGRSESSPAPAALPDAVLYFLRCVRVYSTVADVQHAAERAVVRRPDDRARRDPRLLRALEPADHGAWRRARRAQRYVHEAVHTHSRTAQAPAQRGATSVLIAM